jgi:adsorption protein B
VREFNSAFEAVQSVHSIALWHSVLGAFSTLLLLSGLDDLIPLLICSVAAIRRSLSPQKRSVRAGLTGNQKEERRIAVFVPCWREAAVIGNMVRHNLAAIRYSNYAFFLGVYPNDEDTVRVARLLAEEFSTKVYVAQCPNPGPTSKADCLNAVYACMELLEEETGVPFDTVVLHDAEDLIHPRAFALINRERLRYDMVQVPVLPLKTGFGDVTHGVYCDEFAEFQMIDMRARQLSRSFIPSNGVGTGFARKVLDRLARERNHAVFDAASLTEDYEIGVHIHTMGYRQCFASLDRTEQDFIATREFFPRSMKPAIRQRTRWITGIALQCWERQGWRGTWRTRYWFWRDRKGLITNPLTVLANALFIAGLFDYLLSAILHRPWLFEIRSPTVAALCMATMALQCLRLAIRAFCVGRIFGLTAALGVPFRSFHANLINSTAAFKALHGYFAARRQNRTVAWQKTDHHYPGREALHNQRRELAEILIGCGWASHEQVAYAQAQAGSTEGATLDILLLAHGILTEDKLCKALSLQSGLPSASIDPNEIKRQVARRFPSHVEERHGVVPFDVRSGKLLVATTGIPSRDTFDQVERIAELPVEFRLVTPSTYQQLRNLL